MDFRFLGGHRATDGTYPNLLAHQGSHHQKGGTYMANDTRDLLADYAFLLNRHGPQPAEAADFLEQHKFNTEFVELALISKKLKEALTAPDLDHVRRNCQSDAACQN